MRKHLVALALCGFVAWSHSAYSGWTAVDTFETLQECKVAAKAKKWSCFPADFDPRVKQEKK